MEKQLIELNKKLDVIIHVYNETYDSLWKLWIEINEEFALIKKERSTIKESFTFDIGLSREYLSFLEKSDRAAQTLFAMEMGIKQANKGIKSLIIPKEEQEQLKRSLLNDLKSKGFDTKKIDVLIFEDSNDVKF